MARSCVESQFPSVHVRGEITDLIQHRSGHWYFTLKDDAAQIRVAMFRYQNRNVSFKPENGLEVVLTGKLSIYEARGSFQYIAETMQTAGLGNLQKAFDKLKADLLAQGLFDETHKKPLPEFAQQIAVITSPQGAAIRDIQSTFARRFPGIELVIVPVAVQGTGAGNEIAQAIARCNQLKHDDQLGDFNPEVILLSRGGGSLEDLWAFNEEVVARAIYQSDLPIVSAVGHETDFSIADFVADLRAATPTAAAEILSPEREHIQWQLQRTAQRLTQTIKQSLLHKRLELKALQSNIQHPEQKLQQLTQRCDQIELDLNRGISQHLQSATHRLETLSFRLYNMSPQSTVKQAKNRVEQVEKALYKTIASLLENKKHALIQSVGTLQAFSPLKTLERGYAIVSDSKGNVINHVDQVDLDQTVYTQLGQGQLTCRVEEKGTS